MEGTVGFVEKLLRNNWRLMSAKFNWSVFAVEHNIAEIFSEWRRVPQTSLGQGKLPRFLPLSTGLHHSNSKLLKIRDGLKVTKVHLCSVSLAAHLYSRYYTDDKNKPSYRRDIVDFHLPWPALGQTTHDCRPMLRSLSVYCNDAMMTSKTVDLSSHQLRMLVTTIAQNTRLRRVAVVNSVTT